MNSFSVSSFVCGTYFSGLYCPHCARVDPVLLKNKVSDYNNLVLIKYELQENKKNAIVYTNFISSNNIPQGFPLLVFDSNNFLQGDKPILDNFDSKLALINSNNCVLNNEKVSFENLNLNDLEGFPIIWYDSRVLIKVKNMENVDSNALKELLLNLNFETLENKSFKLVDSKPVKISGGEINFEHALEFDGWVFEWRGRDFPNSIHSSNDFNNSIILDNESNNINLFQVVSLAIVDAINPCALAVLLLMLLAIITFNPRNKKNILLAGLSFSLSVFLMYFVYGLIIIFLFQLLQTISSIKLTLYWLLGLIAVIMGLLQIKDFFYYKPGGFLTEMPLFLRPLMKKIIFGVTSPKGAFLTGLFVTLFLLPCTIGPYVILGGILSIHGLFNVLPYLALYNIIFVSPMILITIIVFKSLEKIEDIQEWKEKHIKTLHLISGLIMFLVGLAMFLGWI